MNVLPSFTTNSFPVALTLYTVWADLDVFSQVIGIAYLKGPLAIIIGSEGYGMSKLVKENADILIKIPMKGKITSLNASVSAGIVIYEAVKQRM